MAFRVTEAGMLRVTEAGVIRVEEGAPSEPAILMEDGASYILLEDGSRILLE
jgi:hypothetical protein